MNDLDPLRPKGGFADLVGYELGQWRKDQVELVLTLEAKHLNRQGTMHGGVLTLEAKHLNRQGTMHGGVLTP